MLPSDCLVEWFSGLPAVCSGRRQLIIPSTLLVGRWACLQGREGRGRTWWKREHVKGEGEVDVKDGNAGLG